ncbi:MAG: hypothetical protein ABIT20_14070 [Gemmatimonadaceae bacterium]
MCEVATAVLQDEIDPTLSDLTDMRGADVAARAYLACRDAIDKLDGLAARLPGETVFERKKRMYFASKKRHRKVTADGCVVRADHLVFATGDESHAFLKRKVAPHQHVCRGQRTTRVVQRLG